MALDFDSAYTRLKNPRQKCLVHLFREIHRIMDNGPPLNVRRKLKTFGNFFRRARVLVTQRRSLDPEVYAQKCQRLHQRLRDFLCRVNTRHKPWLRLARRAWKHQRQMLLFLDVPNLRKQRG
jgi:hypothetical protein